MIDTTGIQALKQFNQKCKDQGITFLVSGLQPGVAAFFKKTELDHLVGNDHIFPNVDAALNYAKSVQVNDSKPKAVEIGHERAKTSI